MFQLLPGICDVAFPVFCNDKFGQITDIPNKPQGNFLAGPGRPVKLCFFLLIFPAHTKSLVDQCLKIHYLSSKPRTAGNNCFFLETTPSASRVPSASGA